MVKEVRMFMRRIGILVMLAVVVAACDTASTNQEDAAGSGQPAVTVFKPPT